MFEALTIMSFWEIFTTTFALGLGLGAAFLVIIIILALLQNAFE